MSALAIVVDLGGTYVRCALATPGAGLARLARWRLAELMPSRRGEDVWPALVNTIASYAASVDGALHAEAPVIVSFPGPVAGGRRILSSPTLLPDSEASSDIAFSLEEQTHRTVHILNDISAAAWYLSLVEPAERFLAVTVSSGVGSKIFDRRREHQVLDDQPYSGEIGHLVVNRSSMAIECGCGGRGHLGTIASGRGVERLARNAALADPDGFAQSQCSRVFGGSAAGLTNEEHIVPAVRSGDAWATAVLAECTRPLADALLMIACAAGLARIVVIGGFALALGACYGTILRREMRSFCDYPMLASRLDALVVLGTPEDDACLRGASVYAQRLQVRS